MERRLRVRGPNYFALATVLLTWLAAERLPADEIAIQETGRNLVFESDDDQEFVNNLVFLGDSRVLAGGHYGPSESLQLFDLKTDRMIRKIPHELTGICDLDVSSDGQRVAAAGAFGKVQIWQTKDWSVLSRHELHLARCVKFLNEASLVASGGDIRGGNDLVVWNVDRQELHRRWPVQNSYFRCLATSPDGKLFASVSNNSILRVWNLQDFSLVATCRGDERIEPTHCLYFFRDSLRIASGSSGSDEPCTRIWNVRTGEQLATAIGWKGIPTAVFGLSDDKYMLTVSRIGEFWVHSVATGKKVFQLKSPKSFHSAALSPNGRTLLTTDFTEITIWNIDIPEMEKGTGAE